MIAQTLAIRHPERVLSLVSIMSSTGDRAVGQPHPEALPTLLTSRPADREGYRGVRGAGVQGDRLAGVRGGRGDAPGAGAGELRSGLSPGGHGAAAPGDPGLGRSDGGAWAAGRADGGDPRDGRRADRRLGREGHRRGDSGGEAGADRGDGARPAAGAVAAVRGPDRGERGARPHSRLTSRSPFGTHRAPRATAGHANMCSCTTATTRATWRRPRSQRRRSSSAWT